MTPNQGSDDETALTSHTGERPEIWQMLDSLQMDLRAANAKLVTLRSIVAGMNVPDPKRVKCPVCGLTFRSVPPLEEHVYLSHGGEEPTHWKIADARAADV